jgi:hypothetical protein
MTNVVRQEIPGKSNHVMGKRWSPLMVSWGTGRPPPPKTAPLNFVVRMVDYRGLAQNGGCIKGKLLAESNILPQSPNHSLINMGFISCI